jgi:hypothetical protein
VFKPNQSLSPHNGSVYKAGMSSKEQISLRCIQPLFEIFFNMLRNIKYTFPNHKCATENPNTYFIHKITRNKKTKKINETNILSFQNCAI